MSIVIDKIKEFENKIGQNINDYLMSTISDYTVQKGISSIPDFCKNHWNEYQDEYLKDLEVNFSTLDPNELTDIVSSFVIYPYSYSNYQSPEVKLQILKQPSAEFIVSTDHSFLSPDLVSKVCEEIRAGVPIDSFSQEIFYNSDIAKAVCEINGPLLAKIPVSAITKEVFDAAMGHDDPDQRPDFDMLATKMSGCFAGTKDLAKILCAYDGRLLQYTFGDAITPELIDIAMNNPDEEKRFNIGLAKEAFSVCSNKEAIEKLCSYDGRFLQYAASGTITSELIKTAMNNPDEEKRFSLDQVEDSRGLRGNVEGMKYICNIDGTKYQYASELTPDMVDIAITCQNVDRRADLQQIVSRYNIPYDVKREYETVKHICELDGSLLSKLPSAAIDMPLVSIALNNNDPDKRFSFDRLKDKVKDINNRDDFYFYQNIGKNSELMSALCQYDGRMLEMTSINAVTEEMVFTAMNNSDLEKRFGLDQLKKLSNFRENSKVMGWLCKYDGRMLQMASPEIITEEMVATATNNSDPGKRFDLKQLRILSSFCESHKIMGWLCKYDGRMLQMASPEIITEEMFDNAINNSDPAKRFTQTQLNENNLLSDSFVVMKHFCGMDGSLYSLLESKSTGDRTLLEIALNSEKAYIPNYDSLFKQKNYSVPTIADIVANRVDSNLYSMSQIEDMLRGNMERQDMQSPVFKKILRTISEYYGFDFDMADYHLVRARETNDEILTTINFEFLQEKYHLIYEDNNYEKLFVLGMYKEVQQAIIDFANPKVEINGQMVHDSELGAQRLVLLKDMLKVSLQKENGELEKNWILYYAPIITSLETEQSLYDNLVNSGEQLSNEELRTLDNYILGKHRFKIENLEDIRNYDEIRSRYIETIISNPTSSVEDLRDAMLEKTYGISLNIAEALWVPYAKGVLSSPDKYDDQTVEFFRELNNILTQQNPGILRQSIFEPKEKLNEHQIITMRADLKKNLVKMYNETLYTTENKKPDGVIQNINVYKAAGENGDLEFNLSITALGAYSGFDPYPKDFNYSEDWNRPKIGHHGICTSYIGNNNLGTARCDYAVLGFTDYESSSLHLAGPDDLNSNNANVLFDVSKAEVGRGDTSISKFLTPKQMIDNTRHTHNEIVFERRTSDGKRQPSYIVFLCDEYDAIVSKYERLVENGVEFAPLEKMKQKAEAIDSEFSHMTSAEWDDVRRLYSAIKASKEFNNLPIVVVERKKIAENEHKKIFEDKEDYQGCLARFRDEENLSREAIQQYYHDIIVEFENNYAGNREYHNNIAEEYFNEDGKRMIIDTIRRKINNTKDLSVVAIMLEELDNVISDEKEKSRNQSSFPLELEKALSEMRKEYELRQNEVAHQPISELVVGQVDNNSPKHILSFMQGQVNDGDYLFEYNQYLNYPNQYSASQVLSMIDEDLKNKIEGTISDMQSDKLYEGREMSAHSSKHVEDVILFAGLVGKATGLSTHDMDLLMEAAKLHDAGRINDANVSHGLTSATLAQEKLGNKYNSEDLGIICAAIAYHEMPDTRDNEGRIVYTDFDKQCEIYGLDTNNEALMSRARQVADCLKDADALDRTRFLAETKSFTNPYLLRNDVSKSLIKVSCQLNESYAVRDIQLIKANSSDEVKTMIDDNLLSTNSPKATLRAYRKGYLNLADYSANDSYGTKK